MRTALVDASTSLSIQNINKSFGENESRTQILFDINTEIKAGDITYIVGPSGCGKTTLISIIASILDPDSGSVNIFGTDITGLGHTQKAQFRLENLGFIFQQFNLVPTLTTSENVAIPLLIQGMDYQTAIKKAEYALSQVKISEKVNYYPRDLSGGQQQRVAIARAIVSEPRLIICDEPTAALDSQTGIQVMNILRDIVSHDERCVIVVTHDNRVIDYADRIIAMEDGKIIDQNATEY